jgi:hypothetical protein
MLSDHACTRNTDISETNLGVFDHCFPPSRPHQTRVEKEIKQEQLRERLEATRVRLEAETQKAQSLEERAAQVLETTILFVIFCFGG